ncbi:SMC-Scp complex subunit ScpB [Coraliomargarita akajimensis]|uniref:Chromosome segregation and condensation protein, ScpB n=1 Tax=Coraliomargarita akajimensis (strain DSM 45221 / IAM 15411 / JCM 23193 / KCTC 12865 / 04OKA010-24) TaxID=583355 RepID=D5EMV6_CORAD|nr:SMC-Scp complex subunit ScpB [Coraliomargarita akajimensis]ADE55346.1 chromosome segregation and condensation protein, ScpB [Coraliomargarita akajimensis DSM 45221]
MELDLKKTLEALLLSIAEPISLKDLVKLFARYHEELLEQAEEAKQSTEDDANEIVVPDKIREPQIREAITALTDTAEVEDKAYRILEGPNGYQLVTAPQFAEFVRLLRGEARPMKLSPAAMETMSIVAYRQPVTRAEIEAIRGVSADGPLNRLIELELVQVTGRAELPGRPIQYGTTEKFLEFTGIVELDELPASDVLSNHQIDDWMRKSEEPEEDISDQDVGLPKEPNPGELPLDEEFAEIDWQQENAESDAAGDVSEPEEAS